jgi:hypothetical protein
MRKMRLIFALIPVGLAIAKEELNDDPHVIIQDLNSDFIQFDGMGSVTYSLPQLPYAYDVGIYPCAMATVNVFRLWNRQFPPKLWNCTTASTIKLM